jgi:MFS superfamily sulfate permease-like transporter
VQTRLTEIAEKLPADTRWFVIDASAITHVDGTGAAMLDEFVKTLAGRGIAVGLAELHADVRGLLERAGVIARIGPAMIFEDLEDMLDAFEASGAGAAGSAAGRDSIAP